MIRCPFCHWSRIHQPDKGAAPWDETQALFELGQHIKDAHRFIWIRLATIVTEALNG